MNLISNHFTNKPLAAPGLTSYRYRGRYGCIMIGAKSHDDALKEAARSSYYPVYNVNLQLWNGKNYENV